MKKSWQFPKIILVILLLCFSKKICSQTFTDELRAKLPKPDQYKILKSQTFYSQGKVYLKKAIHLADSLKLTEKPPLEQGDYENLKIYYDDRIKASYCFRSSNGFLFGVLDKHIREFWKKHASDKQSLAMIVKRELASYDSIVLGDKLRGTAEQKLTIEEKIPLVTQAETLEQNALFTLSKVLYIYLNWPVQPDLAWLYSNDTIDPYKPAQIKELKLSSIQIDTVTVRKDTVRKASSLYSLMHISDNQIDQFNEFLKKSHPDKMELYLIDFQKLYNTAVDSLQMEWRKYLYSGIIPLDTLKSSSQPVQSAVIKVPITQNFMYKVQIAASRVRMTTREQQSIYSGSEKIDESFEDEWYKYTIGSFSTYQEARGFRSMLKEKIKGIFVIAYYNGKRIKITTTLVQQQSIKSNN